MLFLDNNQLSGPIPEGWQLPDGLTVRTSAARWACTSKRSMWFAIALAMLLHSSTPDAVQVLAMWNNQLSGTLPEGWLLPDSLQVHAGAAWAVLVWAWQSRAEWAVLVPGIFMFLRLLVVLGAVRPAAC